jgi:DNA-binding transcriptional ArsR family regulator
MPFLNSIVLTLTRFLLFLTLGNLSRRILHVVNASREFVVEALQSAWAGYSGWNASKLASSENLGVSSSFFGEFSFKFEMFLFRFLQDPQISPFAWNELVPMTEEKIQATAETLQAIGEENRIRILWLLLNGPKNVTEISTALDLPIVNISHHLGILKRSKILQVERQGQTMLYSLSSESWVRSGKNRELKLDYGKVIFANG